MWKRFVWWWIGFTKRCPDCGARIFSNQVSCDSCWDRNFKQFCRKYGLPED